MLNDGELAEKLALDLEARKDRDLRENAAWRDQQIRQIRSEGESNVDRLSVDSYGVRREVQNRIAAIEAEFVRRSQKNEQRHQELDAGIVSGRVRHIWIDAEKENTFNKAKKAWDSEVQQADERYGKSISDDRIEYYRKTYGDEIVDQLWKSTQREYQQRQQAEDQAKQEREERIAKFQEEENKRSLKKNRQQKIQSHQQLGQIITKDTREKKPVDNEIERIKIQKKIDDAAIRRIVEERQAEAQEDSNTLKRINEDIERARARAIQSPVEQTSEVYDDMMKKIRDRRERDRGQGW